MCRRGRRQAAHWSLRPRRRSGPRAGSPAAPEVVQSPLELPRVLLERRLEVVDRRALGEGEEHKGAGELGLVLDLDREHARSRRRVPVVRAAVVGQRGARCGPSRRRPWAPGTRPRSAARRPCACSTPRGEPIAVASIAKPKPDYCLIDPACRPWDRSRERSACRAARTASRSRRVAHELEVGGRLAFLNHVLSSR